MRSGVVRHGILGSSMHRWVPSDRLPRQTSPMAFWRRRRPARVSRKRLLIPEVVPEYESPARRMFADAHGEDYEALRSLEEARAVPDGVVVLEGDWGGQIYVVSPVSAVACDDTTLRRLLKDIDAIAWTVNEGEGASVSFERQARGAVIPGGMGGGLVRRDPWVHPKLEERGLGATIRAVLAGASERLGPAA